MYLLSEKQRRLISALEEKYLDQRLANTARWVDRMARESGSVRREGCVGRDPKDGFR
jgi:hypothetical protein